MAKTTVAGATPQLDVRPASGLHLVPAPQSQRGMGRTRTWGLWMKALEEEGAVLARTTT